MRWFEEVAREAPEPVRFEFVEGRVRVKPGGDGTHSTIVTWLIRWFLRERPELCLYPGRGLEAEAGGSGRALPDGVLAPFGHFAGHGDWSSASGVLMVVEVGAPDRDAKKPEIYAAAGIPVYLLVDRGSRSVIVHAEPEAGRYLAVTKRPFGAEVELPEPVGITLATEGLKDFAE